ncbi:hypothetical protein ACFWBB_03570 [Streptomyces sp. NPDC060000]|uniref:hypothetical protein n=1 Tax=Streptomyces sp. NPDC060000 TaxID=3347031 RepID=UPI0036A48C02
MAVLHTVRPSPGIFPEQAVYLSAAGLAGTGRFLVLRLLVFADSAHGRTRVAAPDQGRRAGRAAPGDTRRGLGRRRPHLAHPPRPDHFALIASWPRDDTAGALFDQLTARERRSHHPIAAGPANGEIAERLFLTEATVQTPAAGPRTAVILGYGHQLRTQGT